ncbi:MAG: hypothetical protein ACFFD1_04790, partial [Candidatus Thorarchaeota archaeon]
MFDKEELRNLRLNQLELVNLNVLFNESQAKIIKKTLQEGGVVLGMKLISFAGLVGRELSIRRGSDPMVGCRARQLKWRSQVEKPHPGAGPASRPLE